MLIHYDRDGRSAIPLDDPGMQPGANGSAPVASVSEPAVSTTEAIPATMSTSSHMQPATSTPDLSVFPEVVITRKRMPGNEGGGPSKKAKQEDFKRPEDPSKVNALQLSISTCR